MERRKTQAMASHSAIFLLLSIFTFVFLGSEYLYVNMVSRIVEESQTVIAQNYALGVNALGFLIYPLINRSVRERNKTILIFSLSFLSIICIFLIQQHISFSVTLAAGVVLFLLLGVFGGSVHYLAACTIRTERIAGLVGISYAAGILLQYANNNLVRMRSPVQIWVAAPQEGRFSFEKRPFLLKFATIFEILNFSICY